MFHIIYDGPNGPYSVKGNYKTLHVAIGEAHDFLNECAGTVREVSIVKTVGKVKLKDLPTEFIPAPILSAGDLDKDPNPSRIKVEGGFTEAMARASERLIGEVIEGIAPIEPIQSSPVTQSPPEPAVVLPIDETPESPKVGDKAKEFLEKVAAGADPNAAAEEVQGVEVAVKRPRGRPRKNESPEPPAAPEAPAEPQSEVIPEDDGIPTIPLASDVLIPEPEYDPYEGEDLTGTKLTEKAAAPKPEPTGDIQEPASFWKCETCGSETADTKEHCWNCGKPRLVEIPSASDVQLTETYLGIDMEPFPTHWHQEKVSKEGGESGGGEMKALNTVLTQSGYGGELRHKAVGAILNDPFIDSLNELSKYQAHVVMKWFELAGLAHMASLKWEVGNLTPPGTKLPETPTK